MIKPGSQKRDALSNTRQDKTYCSNFQLLSPIFSPYLIHRWYKFPIHYSLLPFSFPFIFLLAFTISFLDKVRKFQEKPKVRLITKVFECFRWIFNSEFVDGWRCHDMLM